MKRKLIILLGSIFIVLSVIGTTVLANQNKTNDQHNLKIVYKDRYVIDEMLDQDSPISIIHDDKTLENFTLTKGETIQLDEIKLSSEEIISYWKSEKVDSGYIIKPVIVREKDVNVNFTITNGGKLINKIFLPSVTKTVDKGTKLNEILPEIQAEDNYYFAGWFTLEDVEKEVEIKDEDREDIRKLTSKIEDKETELDDDDDNEDLKDEVKKLKKELDEIESEEQHEIKIINEYRAVEDIENKEINNDKEYVAVLYPDVNNNKKDDRKEKINLAVDFGLDNELHEQEIHVGQPIKLSRPYHDDYIFIDWFLDNQYSERLGDQTEFTKDTTIYAKWKTAEEIIYENEESLIHDERVSNIIENKLNEENQEKYNQEKKL